MCLTYRPSIIILHGSVIGSDGLIKMRTFWPHTAKTDRFFANDYIRVRCTEITRSEDHNTFDLIVTGPVKGSKESTKISFKTKLIQNKKWKDDKKVPENLMAFRALVSILKVLGINHVCL